MYPKIQWRQVIMNVLHPRCAQPPRWMLDVGCWGSKNSEIGVVDASCTELSQPKQLMWIFICAFVISTVLCTADTVVRILTSHCWSASHHWAATVPTLWSVHWQVAVWAVLLCRVQVALVDLVVAVLLVMWLVVLHSTTSRSCFKTTANWPRMPNAHMSCRFMIHSYAHTHINWLLCTIQVPSVLWRCWLGGRKGIRPVKNWVVRCWHGYLSGVRCRLAYGPADATATHCLLLQ